MKNTLLFLFALFCLHCTSAIGETAQKSQDKGPTVSVETLLDQAAKATFAQASPDSIRTIVMAGRIELPQGMQAEFQSWSAEGGKFRMEMKVAGMAVTSACDGKDCYEDNPMVGPRLLQGTERSYSLVNADFKREFHWRQHFKKQTLIGEESLAGVSVYKVLLETHDGFQSTNYYDKSSFFLLRSEMVIKSEMGEFPTVSDFSDFRLVHGLMLPHKITTQAMSHQMNTLVSSVEINSDIPASSFELPEQLRPQ